MRQLVAFVKAANTRRITHQYYEFKFHASLNGATDFPSLEETLGVNSGESEFTPEMDLAFEEQAQKLLREQKALRNV